MTHYELLALLKPMNNNDAIFMKDALFAVVELHKPIYPFKKFEDDTTYCEGCSITEIINWESCPTIEAILKALAFE